MSDLIDRQAAIDALHAHLMYRMGTESNKKRLDDWINSLPSAQPKIIRCKDCLYYHEEECPMTYTEWISWEEDGYIEHDDVLHDNAEDDGYCHKWERRTDE